MEKPLTSVRRESMDLAGLLEEHGDHLLRLCTLYLGDRSQAEDAVQDTFLKFLLEKCPKLVHYQILLSSSNI